MSRGPTIGDLPFYQESQWRDQLWKQEDYVQYLYPALLPSTPSNSSFSPPEPCSVQEWQLLICVEYWNSQPAQWIRHKFDLSEATGIKRIQRPDLNIAFQSVASDEELDKKVNGVFELCMRLQTSLTYATV